MYFQSTNSFVLEPAEYGPESAEPVANVGQIYSVEPQSITCEYSRPVEVFFWDFLPIFLLLSLIVQDADSQITDQTPDVKRESSGLQTTSPLKKEAAEDASEHQVTIEEEVANKSETSLMENSHLSVDVSDANDRSTAMDEGGLTFFPLFIFIINFFLLQTKHTYKASSRIPLLKFSWTRVWTRTRPKLKTLASSKRAQKVRYEDRLVSH